MPDEEARRCSATAQPSQQSLRTPATAVIALRATALLANSLWAIALRTRRGWGTERLPQGAVHG